MTKKTKRTRGLAGLVLATAEIAKPILSIAVDKFKERILWEKFMQDIFDKVIWKKGEKQNESNRNIST